MAAILLVGHRQLPVPAAIGPAGGRLPDHPGADLLSRGVAGGDDVLRHGAAGAAVRRDARAEPDGVHQLRRRVGDHAAIRPVAEPGHRRAGGAGGDQCGQQPAAVRPAGAADLRQGQPGRRADHDAGDHVQDDEAHRAGGSGRYAAGAEDLPAARRGAGQHQRRAAPGGAHPGQYAGAGGVRAEHRRSAHHDRQCQRQHAEGQFRRAAAGVHHQRQRPVAQRGGVPGRRRRLQERRAGDAVRRRHA